MHYPVSVQICTLNEARNIRACIEAVRETGAEEVLVIDGGSSDDTVASARDAGARVIEAGRIGLARQRLIGFRQTELSYVAIIDADDRLDHDWIATMLEELQSGGYAALQSRLRTPPPRDWWSRRWDRYFRESVRPSTDSRMIGRPALFTAQALQGLSPQYADAPTTAEDTFMSKDFQDRGMRQGIGTAVAYRLAPSSLGENIQKFRGYGKGYRNFVEANPDRKSSILKHMLWTIPVARSIPTVRSGDLAQPIFGIVRSAATLAGYLQGNQRES